MSTTLLSSAGQLASVGGEVGGGLTIGSDVGVGSSSTGTVVDPLLSQQAPWSQAPEQPEECALAQPGATVVGLSDRLPK